jgi:mono/diheme cytochrome c family protein
MKRPLLAGLLLAVCSGTATAKSIPGDARRGSELIRSLGCIGCHKMGADGGSTAPDLGRARGRNHTPSSMASAMWNHAPSMWASMDLKGAKPPSVTEDQAGDLFAYFQSIRYFDKPGDAARGARVFTASHCSECHARSTPVAGGGPSISNWKAAGSPLVFAQQMWNHAPQMQAAMSAKKIKWVRLTGDELTDLLVYVQSLPETRGLIREFTLTSRGLGESLFKEKGCFTCHQGKMALDKRMASATVTDFSVAMWNHAPLMAAHSMKNGQSLPRLEAQEMQEIVSYLWDTTVFAEQGNAGRGEKAFAKKQCTACHNQSGGGAPDLKQWLSNRTDPLRPFSIMSVLWQHGPQMLQGMKAKQVPWPLFTQPEMTDLIAYLNSLRPKAAPRAE